MKGPEHSLNIKVGRYLILIIMKKLIFCGVFIALVGIGFLSCKKEEILKDKSSESKEQMILKSNTIYENVSTDGTMLMFSSSESYDSFLSSLTTDRDFFDYLSGLTYLKFKSSNVYTEMQTSEIEEYPEFLLEILNKDGAIQIGNHIYRMDFLVRKVFVIKATDKSAAYADLVAGNSVNKKVKQYEWSEEVVEKVESGIEEKCSENARPPVEMERVFTDKNQWTALLTYNAADTSLMGSLTNKKFTGKLRAKYRWTPLGWDLYCKFEMMQRTISASGNSGGSGTISASWETANVPVKLEWSRRYKVKCRPDTGWMNNITNLGTGVATGQSYKGLRALSKLELGARAYINPGNGFQFCNLALNEYTLNGQVFQARIVHGY